MRAYLAYLAGFGRVRMLASLVERDQMCAKQFTLNKCEKLVELAELAEPSELAKLMELVELAEQVELEAAASRASGTYGNNRQEHTCLRLSFQQFKQQLECMHFPKAKRS